MKVMLDAVFNHCGFRHPYFQDVLDKGKESKYYDCFHIVDDDKPLLPFDLALDTTLTKEQVRYCHEHHEEVNYRTFGFTPLMPKINTDTPLMRDHLLDVAEYWIKTFDIDGWRLDVSNEVSHDFWRAFRARVKAAKQDAYIVGENWDNSNPWLHGDQYDAVMNYELLFPIWNFFGTNIDSKSILASDFVERLNKVLTDYPKNVLRMMYNLVDSHDTTRILELCNNDTRIAKLAYLFMFTFPGAPSVYYGDEVGLSGKHDPDNRRCMIWDDASQDKDMLNFMTRLIALRKENADFKRVDYTWLTVDDESGVLVFKKGETTFIINNSNRNQKVVLPSHLQFKRVTDLMTKEKYNVKESIQIKAYQFKIIK
jgi:glycosidase